MNTQSRKQWMETNSQQFSIWSAEMLLHSKYLAALCTRSDLQHESIQNVQSKVFSWKTCTDTFTSVLITHSLFSSQTSCPHSNHLRHKSTPLPGTACWVGLRMCLTGSDFGLAVVNRGCKCSVIAPVLTLPTFIKPAGENVTAEGLDLVTKVQSFSHFYRHYVFAVVQKAQMVKTCRHFLIYTSDFVLWIVEMLIRQCILFNTEALRWEEEKKKIKKNSIILEI